jgi:hypothetical protein
MAGYSGTPLPQKLGLKAGSTLVLVGAPDGYTALIEPMPQGVSIGKRISEKADIVHIFTTRRAVLQRCLADCRSTLKPSAGVGVVAEEIVEGAHGRDRGRHS